METASPQTAYARSRSGRIGGRSRSRRQNQQNGARGGARATLDLGVLAAGLGPDDGTGEGGHGAGGNSRKAANASGGGLGAKLRALFGGDRRAGRHAEARTAAGSASGGVFRSDSTPGEDIAAARLAAAKAAGGSVTTTMSQKTRKPSSGTDTTSPLLAQHIGDEDTRSQMPSSGAGPPDTDSASMRRSARLSGGLGAASRREERATAASSLGSLQSYAQNTVKDTSVVANCFRGSTSEVGLVTRFARGSNPAASGAMDSMAGSLGQSMSNASSVGAAGMIALDDNDLVFPESENQKTLLSRRPDAFEYPKFALGEYGSPETWNSDVFVLIHNAVRWELMDMYTIIGSLQRRWVTLAMLDMYELCEYWAVFELFIGQMFEIEDQIIFPYMLNVAAESPELSTYYKAAKYGKEKLVGKLYDVGATMESFNTTPASGVFPGLYNQLMDYLPELLEYMETQDATLPAIFAGYCHPEDRIMLNRAVANFLIRAENGRDGIAILTRWIEDSMVLQIWKDENLSARAKSSHKKWITRLDESHVEIARRFQRRLRSCNPSRELRAAESADGQLHQNALPDRRDPPAASQQPDILS